MAKLTLLLLCGLMPSLLAQCVVEKAKPRFSRAVYEFSVNLLTRTAQEKENHFVTSTLSTWMLLACLSLGASDTTLAEMKKVLQLQNHKCFNKQYLGIAKMIASNNNSDVVFEKSSYIFAAESLNILDDYKTQLTQLGSTQIENISFDNPDAAAQIVNDYVSRATHDTIEEIVTPGDFEEALIIMIDAIYFKGSWQVPFPYEKTEVSQFYNEQGDQIGNVNLMVLTSTFNYRSVPMIKSKVLELPYGENGKYAMLFILPNDEVTLGEVIDGLKTLTLKTIYALFEEFGEQTVTVQIPRFKISSDLNNLKELLIDMGLKSMFDSSTARLPYISEYSLYVSNFVQKAAIDVTEEGTVASAVTKAELGLRSYPEEFIATKPFLFMIVDKEIMIPIFTGAYSKPSVY